MIKEVDITENFSEEDLFLIKIKSNALCYKDFDFCESFCQQNNGKTSAYINFLNKNAVIFAKPDSDFEEIKNFLLFKNASNVFCNDFVAQKLKITPKTSGFILKYSGGKKENTNEKFCFHPEFKEIYNLLEKDFLIGDYNDFVSDLSFRIKNGFAKLIKVPKGVIFSGWETKKSSVISAIAVDITERNKGIGTNLLNSFLSLQSEKDVYVYCEEKMVDFYKTKGFEIKERFVNGKFI